MRYRSHSEKAAAKRQAEIERRLKAAEAQSADVAQRRDLLAACTKAEAERDELAQEAEALRKELAEKNAEIAHLKAKKNAAAKPAAKTDDAPKAPETEGQ